MNNNEKMNDDQLGQMNNEQERRERFMVDDDREKPDRLPENESEYLEEDEGLEEDDDDVVLPPETVENLDDGQHAVEDPVEQVPPDADEFDETYSDAILPHELDSEDLERVLTDEQELLDDQPRLSEQLDEDDGLEDGDLLDAERRFIALDGDSSELNDPGH